MNTFFTHRRLCLAAPLIALTPSTLQAQERPTIDVWKSPTCGCCKEWVTHLTEHGFRVKTHDTGNNGMRQRLGMPTKYGACHTARIGDYVIEGHVPAADIIQLLKQKPAALGVAVPGMPIGSPGMDGPAYGNRQDSYDVLLVQRDGSARVFKSHPGK